MRHLAILFAVLALGLSAAVAHAQSSWGPRPSAKSTGDALASHCPVDTGPGGLVNGSFEDGINGWEPDCGFCSWESLQEGEESEAFGGFTAPTPTDGSFSLVSDAFFPDVCRFGQSVDVTAEARFLSADVGYVYRDFDGDARDCRASFSVETTDGVPITTLYQTGGSGNQPLLPRGFVDLGAYEGQTVVLVAQTESCEGGPAGILLDNVRLEETAPPVPIPTLSEWAAILFGLALLGAAAAMLRQRKTTSGLS